MRADRNGDLISRRSGRCALRPEVLVPGLATAIGSLPLADAHKAAALALEAHPRLPAAPQLARAREGVVAQWAAALPEVAIADDGSLAVDATRVFEPVVPVFTQQAHGGLLAFLEQAVAMEHAPARVKLQLCGPLTLGVALTRAGLDPETAFARAGAALGAWAPALEALVASALPDAAVLVFLDEPSLVLWRRGEAPLEREAAVDVLSGSLAAFTATTGVHVCGEGDLRLAYEAGPRVLGAPVSGDLLADADVVARHLDADGWFAWGAVPTDRPIGESADPLWRATVAVWCELTRRGCDPVALRTHGIVTPACGLAGHGPSQAERALRLAGSLAERVGDQAAAVKLTVGA
ncbi:MAG: hypothetical protein FJW88_02255 [Actinobacteria bacterium]|nr:hypothetical protein [Actinomycetota bacterium]